MVLKYRVAIGNLLNNKNNKEILSIVYSKDYELPTEFYKETPENNENTSAYNMKVYNKCTNNYNEAKNIFNNIDYVNFQERTSDKQTVTRIPYKIIKTEDGNETKQYYNFYIVVKEENTQKIEKRTYRYEKCSYLNVEGNKIHFQTSNTKIENAGEFNYRPIEYSSIKELVEYLTYNYRNQLLSEEINEEGVYFRITLYLFQKVGGDWGMCDKIGLYKNIYLINKEDGKISFEESFIRSIDGKCHKNPLK